MLIRMKKYMYSLRLTFKIKILKVYTRSLSKNVIIFDNKLVFQVLLLRWAKWITDRFLTFLLTHNGRDYITERRHNHLQGCYDITWKGQGHLLGCYDITWKGQGHVLSWNAITERIQRRRNFITDCCDMT